MCAGELRGDFGDSVRESFLTDNVRVMSVTPSILPHAGGTSAAPRHTYNVASFVYAIVFSKQLFRFDIPRELAMMTRVSICIEEQRRWDVQVLI